jgi:hypothetical protein
MSIFRRAADKLRRRGVLPATTALGGATATYTTVIGYTSVHLITSLAAGVIFAFCASALWIVETGHWLGSARERTIVEGVKASGVEIESMSAADIRARLSYSPEEGRALVDAIRGVNKELVDELVKWLLTIDSQFRWEAMKNIMILSSEMGPGARKFALARALLQIDDGAAASLGDPDEIANLLRQLANIPVESRQALAAAKFPIRPADASRADLWAVINASDFPAPDLVAPMKEIAQAHPSRLSEIRKYIKAGTAIQWCKPIACKEIKQLGLVCNPGYYLSEQPVCAPDNRD